MGHVQDQPLPRDAVVLQREPADRLEECCCEATEITGNKHAAVVTAATAAAAAAVAECQRLGVDILRNSSRRLLAASPSVHPDRLCSGRNRNLCYARVPQRVRVHGQRCSELRRFAIRGKKVALNHLFESKKSGISFFKNFHRAVMQS